MSLALYRKYRPGQFADVIGQDHVTGPLTRALNSDRIHHAYLFTGPRGCGKTSSARIMARSINCVNGPTSTPCNVCQSCIDLAPNGPGSIDVIEMDAATYRGIDDAKELRERAVYAPVASRYKVYIIDEAHQLTKDAFNVLLKLVEEPPPHLRFIFATTEPDKIIPTLRSRTHHYAFRLVSAKVLQEHLAKLCEQEGIAAEPTALALIARAGAGSVRDSQSVLGQVIAGSGPEGITYTDTVSQLGFTDEVILGKVVTAIARGDGAELFHLVDQIVGSGHEPRRFVADLLERLRDMVVVTQVPDAVTSGLFDMPAEQIADIAEQAKLFTPAQLVRVADLVSSGLSELRGAASPRLQLELLVARLVTPQVTLDLEDRVSKLEQGGPTTQARPVATRSPAQAAAMAHVQNPTREVPAAMPASALSGSDEGPVDYAPGDVAETDTPSQELTSTQPAAVVPEKAAPATSPRTSPPARPTEGARRPSPAAPLKPSQVTKAAAKKEPEASTQEPEPVQPITSGALTLEVLRDNWTSVISTAGAAKKVTAMLLKDSAPMSIANGVVAVGFPSTGMMNNASNPGHYELIAQVIEQLFGAKVRVEGTLSPNVTTPKNSAQAALVDTGDAAPDDDNVSTKSGVALAQEILGARVIDEGTRGA